MTCRDGADAARHDGDRRQRHEHAAALDDRLHQSFDGGFHAAISSCWRFAINILHRSQIEISTGCGGEARGEDRFGHGAWGEENGVPILTDAQARVVCAKEASFDYGSHTIFVGRVTSVGIHGEVDPLIYVDGKYTCLPPDAVAVSGAANGNRDHAAARDVTRAAGQSKTAGDRKRNGRYSYQGG